MKSKAHIKGHPLHPILVCFPIAFFTGALIFDILSLLNGRGFDNTAIHLLIAGLIGGLVAAVPGLIDFIFTVPPKSTAKKRGAKHGLTNLTALILFATALFYRVKVESPVASIVIGLEITGVILLSIAGWMGGTLVYRNQIGVNPRYAGAGKWKEEYLHAINGRVELSNVDELGLNQMRLIHVGNKRIVVAKTEMGWVAFSDHCTHRGGSLASGAMICETVQCPWHGSQFNVKTGNVMAGPAKEKIVVYFLEEDNGKIYLKI